MAVDQLPARVREFANYLDGLLARLDQGGGWCGVFWQRDPEGMQACLDGREIPPWDVVEALLQDLAAAYGPGAAGAEKERARLLHAAALSAYDSRPGARDALGDRLDVMLREQRYAAERQAELSRFLAMAGTPDEAHAIRLDLAWARDDHERATARCAELRARISESDRRGAGGQVRDAQTIRRPGEAGEPYPGPRRDGGSPVNGPAGVPSQRSPMSAGPSPDGRSSGAYGGVMPDGTGTGARPRAGGFGAEDAYRPGPGRPGDAAPTGYASAPGAPEGARGTGAPEPAATRYTGYPSTPGASDGASGTAAAETGLTRYADYGSGPGAQDGARGSGAPEAAPARYADFASGPGAQDGASGTGVAEAGPTRYADHGSGPGVQDGAAGTGVGEVARTRYADYAPSDGVRGAGAAEGAPTRYAPQSAVPADTSDRHAPQPSEGVPAAQAQPPAPAPPAKQRKRRRGSARFAGMVEDDTAPVVVPQTPAPAAPSAADARRTPRGARFAGAAEAAEPPERQVEPLDAEAGRAVVQTVETLGRLRGEERSGEAHALLVEAAHWPAARLPLLAAELHRTGHGADWSTLLWEAASLPAERLVAAADALVAAGRAADGQQILRQGVARPADEIGEAVLALGAEGRRREVRALLDAYVRVRTPEEAARSVAADPQHLVPLVLEAARGVSEERHWDLVHALRVAGFTA